MIADNIIDIGCVGHCDTVITDICIEKAGTYYIEYELDGVNRYIKIVTESDGEKLKIPVAEFPVDREIFFRLLDENQNVMTDSEFSEIRMNTKIKLIADNCETQNNCND